MISWLGSPQQPASVFSPREIQSVSPVLENVTNDTRNQLASFHSARAKTSKPDNLESSKIKNTCKAQVPAFSTDIEQPDWGQSNSNVGRVPALYMANMGLVSDIPYSPSSTTKSDS